MPTAASTATTIYHAALRKNLREYWEWRDELTDNHFKYDDECEHHCCCCCDGYAVGEHFGYEPECLLHGAGCAGQ